MSLIFVTPILFSLPAFHLCIRSYLLFSQMSAIWKLRPKKVGKQSKEQNDKMAETRSMIVKLQNAGEDCDKPQGTVLLRT
jgi:hypothetical protein